MDRSEARRGCDWPSSVPTREETVSAASPSPSFYQSLRSTGSVSSQSPVAALSRSTTISSKFWSHLFTFSSPLIGLEKRKKTTQNPPKKNKTPKLQFPSCERRRKVTSTSCVHTFSVFASAQKNGANLEINSINSRFVFFWSALPPPTRSFQVDCSGGEGGGAGWEVLGETVCSVIGQQCGRGPAGLEVVPGLQLCRVLAVAPLQVGQKRKRKSAGGEGGEKEAA